MARTRKNVVPLTCCQPLTARPCSFIPAHHQSALHKVSTNAWYKASLDGSEVKPLVALVHARLLRPAFCSHLVHFVGQLVCLEPPLADAFDSKKECGRRRNRRPISYNSFHGEFEQIFRCLGVTDLQLSAFVSLAHPHLALSWRSLCR